MIKVEKGWGHEEILCNDRFYCGKFLYVDKDRECSVHYHRSKHETFHILKGEILFKYWEIPLKYRDIPHVNDEYKPELLERYWDGGYSQKVLKAGDTFILPQYLAHQFRGVDEESVIVEFSTEHFDEDSYRIIIGDQL